MNIMAEESTEGEDIGECARKHYLVHNIHVSYLFISAYMIRLLLRCLTAFFENIFAHLNSARVLACISL